MQLQTLLLTTILTTLTLASPVAKTEAMENLEARQCFSGPFVGGECGIYGTPNIPGEDCGDLCIAEGTRRKCCTVATFSLDQEPCGGVLSGFAQCNCNC